MMTKEELIFKYDTPGPRYTSFPAYPHWKDTPSTEEWMGQILLKRDLGAEFDLYVHIPFCRSLCIYCGCSRMITRDLSLAERYVDALIKEWNQYKRRVGYFPVKSIHLGGGTPTFLPPELLEKLIKALKGEQAIEWGAVEVDPRVTSKEHCKVLVENGFKKFSLGIQDFDEKVQRNINRVQPFEMVELLTNDLRSMGVESLNFDIIFGLPGQSLETIKNTFEKVSKLRPDTIAFYSYAHVPWKIKSQKALEKIGLPSVELKRSLYECGKECLEKIGYHELGMDHFSLKEDQLYKAYERGELKRSFMGYTAKKGECLIGLGCSSISSTGFGYVQNEKEVPDYLNKIENDQMAYVYGHTMTYQDRIIDQTIQALMCQGSTPLERVLLNLEKEHARKVMETYEEMMRDGILKMEDSKLEVLDQGKPFIRNICMALDPNLTHTPKEQFSRTI
ncbi:MAG: oxygen-independent coproporphyrinogen III oxidase [Deltaproteobacteria bacterium]|nr:MAG: oxygen-independent coproporphyrinogen III oxidase [Deltaproteobacteria bacterium]